MINNSNSSFASPNNPLLANANTSSSKQANQATEKFINRYYKIMDELRHSLVKLYHKDATLVWNGNEVTGADKIHDYYRMFPSSWHTVESYDAMPITCDYETQKQGVSISVSGSVKYSGEQSKRFFQAFILIVEDLNWKIQSDVFRFDE